LAGSPFSEPGSSVVRPTYVLAGEIWARPIWLMIGMEIAEAPELNSPM
jgi:hypothetical protein